MKISICVPYHNTPKTAFFLSRLLRSLDMQSFKDYEVILTKDGLMAENTNSAMSKAKGELIKILYMDDFFAHPDALKMIVENFKDEDTWAATGCLHESNNRVHSPHKAEYTEDIKKGVNTIGSPSVVTLRNKGHLKFDETLSFLLDCDLYKRYHDKFGPPKIINDYNVIIGLHAGQVSNTMSNEEKLKEYEYIYGKHK